MSLERRPRPWRAEEPPSRQPSHLTSGLRAFPGVAALPPAASALPRARALQPISTGRHHGQPGPPDPKSRLSWCSPPAPTSRGRGPCSHKASGPHAGPTPASCVQPGRSLAARGAASALARARRPGALCRLLLPPRPASRGSCSCSCPWGLGLQASASPSAFLTRRGIPLGASISPSVELEPPCLHLGPSGGLMRVSAHSAQHGGPHFC